jgi:hypothetical protein
LAADSVGQQGKADSSIVLLLLVLLMPHRMLRLSFSNLVSRTQSMVVTCKWAVDLSVFLGWLEHFEKAVA